MGMTQRLPKLDGTVGAALALAAHYFPARDSDGQLIATFQYAAYLMTGHVDKWSRWHTLPIEEKRRIAAVVGFAPEELANTRAFTTRARDLLGGGEDNPTLPFHLGSGARGGAIGVVPQVGGDL